MAQGLDAHVAVVGMKHDALGWAAIPPGSTDLLDVLLKTTGHLLTHREMKQGRNEGREREKRKGEERRGKERRGEERRGEERRGERMM